MKKLLLIGLVMLMPSCSSEEERLVRVTLEGNHASLVDSVMTVPTFSIHVAAVWIEGRALACVTNSEGVRGWIEVVPTRSLDFQIKEDPMILVDENCNVVTEYEGEWGPEDDEYGIELRARLPTPAQLSLIGGAR